jgi:hypothetical protein
LNISVILLVAMMAVEDDAAGGSSLEQHPATRSVVSTPPPRQNTSSSVIPTPVQNEIARVLNVESADPYFDGRLTGTNGVIYNKYKTMEPLFTPVPTEEVLSILSVEDSGPVWGAMAPGALLSDWFRTKITGVLPAQVALAFDQKFALDFERADKRGRAHSAGSLLIGYRDIVQPRKMDAQ